MSGRIVFPGNPWGAGHVIEELAWTGRLEAGTGLWFDLHLVSERYDADDPPDTPNEGPDTPDGGPDVDDWVSKIVWNNYHRCTLSSTYWGHRGFLAGTERDPLVPAELGGREFRVDQDPDRPDAAPDDPGGGDFAFGVYLLGHDSAAAHRIRFVGQPGGAAFGLEWEGLLALTYSRAVAPFEHTFRAGADRVRLEHISVPDSLSSDDAQALLARVLAGAGEFVLAEQDGRRRFVRSWGAPGK